MAKSEKELDYERLKREIEEIYKDPEWKIMTVGEYCKQYKEAEEWNKQNDTTKENQDGA